MDKTYAQFFSNFMINPENSQRYSIQIYTELGVFKENTRNKKSHILLTDVELSNEDRLPFEKVITLSEVNDSEDNVDSVFKYQPLKDLLTHVLAKFYENSGKVIPNRTGKNKESIISFYSGSAGAGKTLFALCFARYLSMQGKRVFYLNLEGLHTTSLYFTEEKQSSAEVLYYLKNNKERLISKIESLKSRDSLTNIEYFSLPPNPEEMEILSREEILGLVHALKQTQHYDYIIIDLDSSLHERNKAALEVSTEVFWLLTADQTSFERSKQIINEDYLETELDQAKIHFVLNKIGETDFDGLNEYNYSIEKRVPFKTAWLEMSEEQKFQSDTKIGESLFQLLKTHMVKAGV